MINKAMDWNVLSARTGITQPGLIRIANKVLNKDFHVKRSDIRRIRDVLKFKTGYDFRELYGGEYYDREFGDETDEEKSERLKGAMITGKGGALKGMTEEEKVACFKKAEETCVPEAHDPEFNIQDFINRQSDRRRLNENQPR